MEERLWRICEKLRGGVEVHDYKHVILPLVFLRCADLNFEKRLQEIKKMKHFSGELLPEFFNDNGGIYLADDARWDYLVDCAKKEVKNLDARLDRAFRLIMEDNPKLDGIFKDGFIASLNIDSWKLSKVILEINKINYALETTYSTEKVADIDLTNEVLRSVYMLLLKKFSAKETRGKSRGEFYTPKIVTDYIKEHLELGEHPTIYDPCIGMGGLVLPILQPTRRNVEIYGQEINPETLKFAKLDFIMQGYNANLAIGDTLENDAFKNLKVDIALCNPPFNLKTKKYKNANFAWINLCLDKLKEDGIAIIILPGTALIDPKFAKERRELLNYIDAIVNLPIDTFDGVSTPISIWILKEHCNGGRVNFIDLRAKEKTTSIFNFTILEDGNVSLNPSKWFGEDITIHPDQLDLEKDLEKEILKKEIELRKLKGMLDFTIDWEQFKNVTLGDVIEEIDSKTILKPNEFAINLIHVGRDKKLPVTLNSTDKNMIVPKSYHKFKIREKWQKIITPDYLCLLLTRPELAEKLVFLSDKSAWGEVKVDELLAVKIN